LKVSTLVFDVLEETYFAGRHSDVEDIVQNESSRCQKVVFAFDSQYFNAMFLPGMSECYDGVLHLQENEKLTFD
jgi:hypothetical protein